MQRILKDRLECLFWTDLIAVSPAADPASLCAVIFNASGKRKLPFARILDTRAETPAWPAPRRWTGKSLRALLHGRVDPEADPEELARIAWRPGRFETESTLGLAVAPETDFPEARRRLLEAWRQRPAALANVRIAALATEFQYDCPAEPVSPAPGLLHVPSAGFANPVAAFDAGATLAMEMSS